MTSSRNVFEPRLSQFHAGVVGVAPRMPRTLFGYRERRKKACSERMVLEANWLRIASLSQVPWLLISIDTLYSSTFFEDSIREGFKKFCLDVPSLFIVASHTHYAPALDDTKHALGEPDRNYIREVAQLIVEDVVRTLQNDGGVEPTCWTFASEECPGAVYRRAKRFTLSARSRPHVRVSTQIAPNPSVPIDREMRIWIARNRHNSPLFVLVTWPCHATSRREDGEISADFVHSIRSAIRDVAGNSIPVFYFPGASGDIRPEFVGFGRRRKILYPYPFQRSFTKPDKKTLEDFDRRLAKKASLCASQIEKVIKFGSCYFAQNDVPHADFISGADNLHMRISLATLGGINLYGFGAEISSFWPKLLGLDGDRLRNLVTGCVGPCFGYLPADFQVPNGGYEVVGFRRTFQLKGAFTAAKPIALALSKGIKDLSAHHEETAV